MEPKKQSNEFFQCYIEEQKALVNKTKEYIPKQFLNKRGDDWIDPKEVSSVELPKKADYRMRAHCNPLSDTAFPFPLNPNYVDWCKFFPKYFENEITTKNKISKLYLNTKEYPLEFSQKVSSDKNGSLDNFNVDFIDIGCGYGGLLFALSQNFPNKNSFGIEIRDKVVNYVGEKIQALRYNEDKYHNISVIRHNSMRHLTNFFRPNQLEKIFVLFPDPHFKTQNHRRRIINKGFLSEYAYTLKKGGKIYAITDVEELHLWHEKHLDQHSLFERVSDEENENDICVDLIANSSEESQKVERAGAMKYYCVYRVIKK